MIKKRIVAFYIDLFLVSFITVVLFIVIEKLFNINLFLLEGIIFMSFYFCKDLIFEEGSLDKKICKLKIITNDNQKVSIVKRVLRNIIIYIWPVELILVNKRLSDSILNIKVSINANI